MHVTLLCPTYFYTKGIECCAAAEPPLSGWQKHCLRYPPASCRFGHRQGTSLRALFFLQKQQLPAQNAPAAAVLFYIEHMAGMNLKQMYIARYRLEI